MHLVTVSSVSPLLFTTTLRALSLLDYHDSLFPTSTRVPTTVPQCLANSRCLRSICEINQSIFVHSSGQEIKLSFSLVGPRNKGWDLSLEIFPARTTHVREDRTFLSNLPLHTLNNEQRGMGTQLPSPYFLYLPTCCLPPSHFPKDEKTSLFWFHRKFGQIIPVFLILGNGVGLRNILSTIFSVFRFSVILVAAILETSSDGCLGI